MVNNSCLPHDQYYQMMTTFNPSQIFPVSGHFFVCGNQAYNQLPPTSHGSCYVAFLVPSARILQTLPKGRVRNRRDQYTPLTLARTSYMTWTKNSSYSSLCLLPYMCVVFQQEYEMALMHLQSLVELFFNETRKVIHDMNKELSELRNVVLQNRLALDIMLALQGGVCELIRQECCFFVSDTFNSTEQHLAYIAEMSNTHMGEPLNLSSLFSSI